MKKISVLVVALVLVLSLMAVPALAAPGNGNGAVKADWHLNAPTGDVVGSVIVNTTGNGTLNVLVNVDNQPGLNMWDVRVVIKNGGGTFDFPNVLDTNAMGQGNAQVKVEIPRSILDNYDVMNNLEVIAKESLSPDSSPPRFIAIINVPLK